jgi:oligoribonuclease NrnB/cAMP/cGMP phosphodiesterase (DHH superfamily)
MSKKNVLLYHANCPDGFGAAYSFWKKFGDDMEYIPVKHGQPPPEGLSGKNVYIADFAYKRDILLELNEKTYSLSVIDHHISAERDLKDLDFCSFDMSHSGAYLSWVYNFPEQPVPKLIKYIEDRDLWIWKMPHAEEVLSAIDSYDRTFEWWDYIDSLIETQEGFDRFLNEGEAILRYKKKLVYSISENRYDINISGDSIPVVNTPFFQSEVAGSLSEDNKYAAAYYFDGKEFIFSLRSSDDDIDVSEIAKTFGGGGHKKAAGFSTKSIDLLEGD